MCGKSNFGGRKQPLETKRNSLLSDFHKVGNIASKLLSGIRAVLRFRTYKFRAVCHCKHQAFIYHIIES